jgi:beta-lactamase class D
MHLMLLSLLLAVVCLENSHWSSSTWEERADFEKYFKAAGVSGAFVIYDAKQDKYLACNFKRLHTPFIPASTYKILNSLIALETGVIADENEIIKWDGVDRGLEAWNCDHNLRSAFKVSAVWFYQEVARRIGQERMQYFVDTTGYGNRDISGGIDMFWLTGGLRITPKEQVDFLVRLYRNDLPFTQRSIDIVKDIMIFEKKDEYVWRAKTGWANEIGWFVGYVERGGNVYFFANNIDILKDEDREARIQISRNILHDLGLVSL